MASANATSIRALTMELKALHREPVEGFTVTVPNDADMYVWHVAIFGPPDTPYQGGYFKVTMNIYYCPCSQTIDPSLRNINCPPCNFLPPQAEMKFPIDYPYSPPRLRFLTPILHPNVYTVSTPHREHIYSYYIV